MPGAPGQLGQPHRSGAGRPAEHAAEVRQAAVVLFIVGRRCEIMNSDPRFVTTDEE
jgi:hypothetical protein